MESPEGKTEMELPRPTPPCWKKKSADAGFIADFKDHFDQLVHASMEQHRICLKKSMRMESRRSQSEKQHPAAMVDPAMTSCRKKKSEDATFLQDLRDHADEFIHASMDEHKTCFTKTIQKMFGMSKVVAERTAEAKEVESSLPLKTTVSQ